jgi:hypothetical protein
LLSSSLPSTRTACTVAISTSASAVTTRDHKALSEGPPYDRGWPFRGEVRRGTGIRSLHEGSCEIEDNGQKEKRDSEYTYRLMRNLPWEPARVRMTFERCLSCMTLGERA